MKHILKKLFSVILLLGILSSQSSFVYAVSSTTSQGNQTEMYTTLRTIDLGTFNEYRYKMTQKFFVLKEKFQVNDSMDLQSLRDLAVLADAAYKYLPDNLENQNLLNDLLIDIQRGVKNLDDSGAYVEIIKSLAAYLEDAKITEIEGEVTATPSSGNAPLSTTLRGKVSDPSGTQIQYANYTWWYDNGGQKVIVGRGPTINYTFNSQGNYALFLDVTSSHKNANGNIDVLPLRKRVDIKVLEKLASVIINVNGERVVDGEELKFTPEVADYGILFDATSSTPTDGTKFVKSEWNFGNGVIKTYAGGPKVVRVRYGNEGDYEVSLKLYTNEGNVVTTNFIVYVRDPIAQIEVDKQDGYIGDKFTFSAKSSGIYSDLTYNWSIIDIDKDAVLFQKSDKTITYSFQNKGKYNVQLQTRRSNGEVDQDTRIVYVTSQTPIAEFTTEVPYTYKPNTVYFDGTLSYDPDYTDNGKLSYQWIINGEKVILDNPSANGATGYYTFSSVGTQNITLEVTDPDGLVSTKADKIDIESTLSVEMFAFPRVIQREKSIKFSAQSPQAIFYEWDFGDGKTQGGNSDTVSHTYTQAGNFTATVTVTDKSNNTNTYSRTIYVSESNAPLAVINAKYGGGADAPVFEKDACDGKGAYIVDRVSQITLDAAESINIDGNPGNLDYSWKVGQDKYSTAQNLSHTFDEIGCFPVKLTVQSQNNGSLHSTEQYFEVQNSLPRLTSLEVTVQDPETDPLIVDVSALGAEDKDGVIQSYMWYYYTDTETSPQDFRSSLTPNTTFVLPKVPGNYYFVVILKDNNEAKISSEQATGSRYYTTITGDNINTPIVDLQVSDSSTSVGEEVTFSASAQNILGKDVSSDSEFSWDFDGDGFYDTQTSTPTISYIYKKSGEFYAKVKVKHRGISSTKNVTINVSNNLLPDFGYISIGNKILFFDASLGNIDNRTWNMGDGTKKTGSSFEYEYSDGKNSHEVTLQISEGTKVKEVTKSVQKNLKNLLKIREGVFNVFTYPEVQSGSLTLESSDDQFFVYLGENSKAAQFAIDYDTQTDSNFNGGMDDDTDNKGTASFVTGDVVSVPLNGYRQQTIRVFTLGEDGKILGSQDITITKDYIEQEEINPDLIIFDNVTESEKQKIEKIKSMLSTLGQQQKITALSYIQKLQENWNDPTEKTRTILDFENYIFELQLKNENEFISLLESLLVEGQQDQSEKQITYQALVNLLPQKIECDAGEQKSCYDLLVDKITIIRDSSDVEANKALGKEILQVVQVTPLMTKDEKIDFKAILVSLINGAKVENIPEDEKKEIISETPTSSSFSLTGILGTLGKVLLAIIVLIVFLLGGFYLAYILIGKKQNKSFKEFITRTTNSQEDEGDVQEVFGEPLSDVLAESSQKPNVDIFGEAPSEKKTEISSPSGSNTQETPAVSQEVPDWLKSSFSASQTQEKKETLAVSQEVPEISLNAPITQEVSLPQETPKTQETSETIPDWLKGSFEETPSQEAVIEESASLPAQESSPVIQETPSNIQEQKDVSPPLEEVSVPDWLKGSFDTPKQEETTSNTVQDIAPSEDAKEEISSPENISENTEIGKKTEESSPASTKISKPRAKSASKKKTDTDTQKNTTSSASNDEELWDDGMKIPDWLKADDEK